MKICDGCLKPEEEGDDYADVSVSVNGHSDPLRNFDFCDKCFESFEKNIDWVLMRMKPDHVNLEIECRSLTQDERVEVLKAYQKMDLVKQMNIKREAHGGT